MTIAFFTVVITMLVLSLLKPRSATDKHAIEVDTSLFKVTPGFVFGSVIICGILAALYTIFW